jgi:hypothetical protein
MFFSSTSIISNTYFYFGTSILKVKGLQNIIAAGMPIAATSIAIP